MRVLGLLADNGPDWVAVDLDAEAAGIPLVPLPTFFTPAQLAHAVASTGMDALYCTSESTARALGFHRKNNLPWYSREAPPVPLPPGTAKITFTSGTTGAPKGVCLSAAGQRAVAQPEQVRQELRERGAVGALEARRDEALEGGALHGGRWRLHGRAS